MNNVPQLQTAQSTGPDFSPIPGSIPFSGPLTIYECAELKTLLLEIIAAPVPQQVDLSRITHCDGAGVQLLVATGKSARRLGQPPCFANPSEAICQAIRQAGLNPERIVEFFKETADESSPQPDHHDRG